MDGSSKILTVSYGTFSCTLEGFDDPLGAMRDIAEYFRDLAADDRYFGAEPPTPDVDMLQSIAEREVNRRVEASTSETGVALRQVEQDVAPVESAAVAKSIPSENEDAGAIAARVVSAAKAVEVVTDAVDEPTETPPADTPDTGTGPLTFDDDFLMADEPEDVLAIDPAVQVNMEGPAESVAEKLRRIRAVVSRNIDAQSDTAVEEAVELPQDDAAKRDRALTETIEQITADLSEDEAEDAPENASGADEPGQADTEDDQDVKADTAQPEESDAQEEAVSARVESAARDTSEALWVRDEEETASDEDLLKLGSEGETDDDDIKSLLSDDTENAVTSDDTENAEASDAQDTEAKAAADEEASVKRRVSDIIGNVAERIERDAENADADADDLIEDDPDDGVSAEPESEGGDARDAQSKSLSEDQDDNVGRLMAETDTKLNEDDVVRRRRVISQMRAAVAATKADRLVSRQVPREDAEEEERSPYRNDLSEVVRAATAAPEGSDRPKTSSPPLVLVSSQRVNFEDQADDSDTAAEVPEDFKDFAENMGAKELSELLEAAAAYTVFGEGHPTFTRPEIMKRVAAVDPTIRMSREESLRSFGQLLRQGKFRKLERGQFTIDQDTKFNPKHRIAGE